MKGIKEKSFELFPEMHTDSDDWDVIEEQCDRDEQRKAFVNGANAVLEKIESLIENRNGEGEVYHYNLYMGLQKLVKELKGE